MAATYNFVRVENTKQKEKKKASREHSSRSADNHNSLVHKDVAQLSDGLNRLEELLKSGMANKVKTWQGY